MLITGKNNEQELREQTIMFDRIVKRYERTIAREIARAMREAASRFGQPLWEIEVEHKHTERMGAILYNLWKQSGTEAAERLFKLAKSVGVYETKNDDEFDLSANIVTQAIADWVFIYGGVDITEVTRTTMLNINDIVAAGVNEGLSERAIGKLIAEIAPSKSASRAQTIARTESHRAANGVSLFTAKHSNIPMLKTWITNLGSRARDAHVKANGQKVGLHEKFIVDGERLDYAGDPSGSAGNVINCRCVNGYEIDSGQPRG